MILTEEQEMIRDTAREFAQRHLAPHAAEWERTATFPREALREMGKLGLLGMTVPAEWGGAGTDYVSYALAMEEIAAGDAATACVMSGHNSVGCGPLVAYGTPEQKERYLRPMARGEYLSAFALTEPSGGSDAGALRTRAVRRGDVYVLSGTKLYITTGKNADVCLVFANTDPSKGKRGITAFIVETKSPGYRVGRTEKKMGQNASDTCEIHFDDMEVPVANRLGADGQGYRIALSNLEGGRIGIAAQAVGMARAALDYAIGYARERQAFGQPIMDFQAVGFRLVDAKTRLEAARQLVLHAARLKADGRPALEAACMAKLFASETAEAVCTAAIQTLGGYGYLADYPVERIYRDVRICQIYEGTSDIQKVILQRML